MPHAKRPLSVPSSPQSGPRLLSLTWENLPYFILSLLATVSLLSRLYLALR